MLWVFLLQKIALTCLFHNTFLWEFGTCVILKSGLPSWKIVGPLKVLFFQLTSTPHGLWSPPGGCSVPSCLSCCLPNSLFVDAGLLVDLKGIRFINSTRNSKTPVFSLFETGKASEKRSSYSHFLCFIDTLFFISVYRNICKKLHCPFAK